MKKLALFLVCTVIIVTVPVLLSGCKEKSASESAGDQTQNTANAVVENAQATADEAVEQTTCPVMKNPINKDVYVEYQGKKVYFCCEDCKEQFAKNPEKYIKDLPQFN